MHPFMGVGGNMHVNLLVSMQKCHRIANTVLIGKINM